MLTEDWRTPEGLRKEAREARRIGLEGFMPDILETAAEEIDRLRHDNSHLRAVLIATQRALREMQTQRDRAREGKR